MEVDGYNQKPRLSDTQSREAKCPGLFISLNQVVFVTIGLNNKVIRIEKNRDKSILIRELKWSISPHAQGPVLFIIWNEEKQFSSPIIKLITKSCGEWSQAPALGPVINSGELTVMHRIQAAFDNVMLYGLHYPSDGIDDTSEMKRNRIKWKIKVREKQNWTHFFRGSM